MCELAQVLVIESGFQIILDKFDTAIIAMFKILKYRNNKHNDFCSLKRTGLKWENNCIITEQSYSPVIQWKKGLKMCSKQIYNKFGKLNSEGYMVKYHYEMDGQKQK